MKLGNFGGHQGDGNAKRGIAKLIGGIPFILLALAAWAVALAGKLTPPLLNPTQIFASLQILILMQFFLVRSRLHCKWRGGKDNTALHKMVREK